MDEAPEDAVPAGELPGLKRALCEHLLAVLDLVVGACKLTLVAHDGQLRYMLREEKIGASALDRPPRGRR
ncbi:MAG: hypothetical protein ACXW0F_12965 [Gaiellaceae bacterium]